MRIQIIFLFILTTSHIVNGQVNPFVKDTFEYFVSGTTASDTNCLFFLKSTYDDLLNSRTENDRIAVFIEVPEDDIFYCLSNHISFVGDLYELAIYNLKGTKSKTGGLLNRQYEVFYSTIISESESNQNLIVRGVKNPVQLGHIWLINQAFERLIDESDSIQISKGIINQTNLENDIAKKIKERIYSLNANWWLKNYMVNWIERLQNLESDQYNDNSWSKLIESCNKKIELSPWENTKLDYILTYYNNYLNQAKLIQYNSQRLVLCNFEKYKVVQNKKFIPTFNYQSVSKGFSISIYSGEKRKFVMTLLDANSIIRSIN